MKIIECPRDAMQGLHDYIPAEVKATYINQLLTVGFDTIDFGSFVSPKAIPQLKDTAEVLRKLNLENSTTKLLAIVANLRGAQDAGNFEEIDYLGFPFSISETFQQRNTNASISEALGRVAEIQNQCMLADQELVVYISMAFGNPYGDVWHEDIACEWIDTLHQELDISTIALADTIGVSNPENISSLFNKVIPEFPKVEIGAHLHTTPDTWKEKIVAVTNAGCTRIDAAIKGFGGCPMAEDDLVGNMATENVLSYFNEIEVSTGIKMKNFEHAMIAASNVFPS